MREGLRKLLGFLSGSFVWLYHPVTEQKMGCDL